MILISNFATSRFKGYVPATVPERFARNVDDVSAQANNPKTGAALNNVRICYGQVVGAARMAWIPVDLEGGESIAIDPTHFVAMEHEAPPLPASTVRDPVGQFCVTVNGHQLGMVPPWGGGPSVEVDGVALRGHWRGRVSLLTIADVWIAWVPGEPWARFEVTYTCSNPNLPLTSDVYPNGFELRIGNAIVGYLGHRFGRMLENEVMAQGQARSFAGVCFWQHLAHVDQMEMAAGLLHGAPVGVDQRWEAELAGLGVPERNPTFNHRAWVAQNYTDALHSLYRWDPPQIGVTANSGNTGSQEDQCFASKGAECFGMQPISSLAVVARYAVALGMSKRPCHWREADGSLLDLNGHKNPRLVLYGGGPHWHPDVSPDRLGLPGTPTMLERHYWDGPDREHWFMGSAWVASMLTGSRALQLEFESQARLVLFGETVAPGISTSGTGAARSVGWFGIMATGLFYCLQNRNTAFLVRQRALDRLRHVYVPQLTKPAGTLNAWDVRIGDGRLLQELDHHFENVVLPDGSTLDRAERLPPGASSWQVVFHWQKAWMPWQQALGAYGLWLMSSVFGADDGKALALAAAKAVVDHAYDRDPVKGWVESAIMAYPEDGVALPDGVGRQVNNPGYHRLAWMPLAAWVVLQDNPVDARAHSIWTQLRAEAVAALKTLDWFPPVDRNPAPTPFA